MSHQMKFASVLTNEADIEKAAAEIGRSVRRQLEDRSVDLALVFTSSHYSGFADDLLVGIREAMSPGALVARCSGASDAILGRTMASEPAVGRRGQQPRP